MSNTVEEERYKLHNFESGDVLEAKQLNEMDAMIKEVADPFLALVDEHIPSYPGNHGDVNNSIQYFQRGQGDDYTLNYINIQMTGQSVEIIDGYILDNNCLIESLSDITVIPSIIINNNVTLDGGYICITNDRKLIYKGKTQFFTEIYADGIVIGKIVK